MKPGTKTVAGLTLILLAGAAVWAQGPATKGTADGAQSRQVRIPVRIADDDRARIEKVNLFVSLDDGKTWRQAGEITPDKRGFDFSAKEKGAHWFATQAVGKDGAKYPEDLAALAPSLIVVFDGEKFLPPKALGQDAVPREAYEALRKDVEDLRTRLEAAERKLSKP